MSVLESATESANRIIHGDTNPDDVQLVAGELLALSARLAQECALRAQAEQDRDELVSAADRWRRTALEAAPRLREYEEALRIIHASPVAVPSPQEIAGAVLASGAASGGREA